ncbi:BZ3500_MvSof-1268-A1-R1_Chr3-2g06236 [Microbotryum saponariae]|uniref:BZ3500_MvSof-1268-A1-R1_Chr3-2g06236 protein n=1 Tax=Microbotryum saponariae TaxID=289078 RepID=A0A2X0KW09_9BASI|nr:BZ3500_MvSof-1268-A1-R1_Chr3-2g06236 [Microbotryum saponariae]SDA04177.1 BZ3501_MvSof-1269-A2-R1_Chr3-2g05927 [Microbotryum saponariae]
MYSLANAIASGSGNGSAHGMPPLRASSSASLGGGSIADYGIHSTLPPPNLPRMYPNPNSALSSSSNSGQNGMNNSSTNYGLPSPSALLKRANAANAANAATGSSSPSSSSIPIVPLPPPANSLPASLAHYDSMSRHPSGAPPLATAQDHSPYGSSSSSTGKRRISASGSTINVAGTPDAAGSQDEQDDEDSASAKKKRSKTPRACDALPDTEPPICVHCHSHHTACTWFLPIAETRNKRSKPKQADDPSSAVAASQLAALSQAHHRASSAGSQSVASPHTSSSIGQYHYEAHPSSANRPSFSSTTPLAGHLPTQMQTQGNQDSDPFRRNREMRIVGPTSISHLMHSTSTFPAERLNSVDSKYSQSLTVDETGDGFIRINGGGDYTGEAGGPDAHPQAIQGLDSPVAEQLLNHYFTTHSRHFPVVTRADFAANKKTSILLFNTLCGISGLSHHVAPGILRTIKGTIRAILREQDFLDDSSMSNIQALLVYAFSLELEKKTPASKTWNLLGVAIRMAQDLGLHRKFGTEKKLQSEADHCELRRRVWGGCLIADRWIAAIYGCPMMIDLADCDCLLPSVFDIRPGTEFDAERKPYLFNGALISLSILLGRIIKAIYSPTGIMTLSAADATSLFDDLEHWVSGLPSELRFNGPNKSTAEQGFLRLLYLPAKFLVTRPFMSISFQLPKRFAHLSVGVVEWGQLEAESREAIEWVDKNEAVLEGWFVGIYAFFIASLIQYHSHIRRRDAEPLATLKLARDIMKRVVVPDGETHLRYKISEILHLLYQTALSVQKWAPEAAEGMSPASGSNTTAIATLNPTPGVRQREQDWHLKYVDKKGTNEVSYFRSERRTPSATSSPASAVGPSGTQAGSSVAGGSAISPLEPAESNGLLRHSLPLGNESSIRSTHQEGEENAGPMDETPAQSVTGSTAVESPGQTDRMREDGAPTDGDDRPADEPTSTPMPTPGDFATMNFNPMLNFAAATTNANDPSNNADGAGSTSANASINPGAQGNTSASSNMFLGGVAGHHFDPFGFNTHPEMMNGCFAGAGGNMMLPPENIFDVDSWSSFFQNVPGMPAPKF